MSKATYTQPDTITDQEVLLIVLGVVRGMGPISEENAAPVIQKALDMLHEARTDSTLLALVMDGKIDIVEVNQAGELVFQKSEPDK